MITRLRRRIITCWIGMLTWGWYQITQTKMSDRTREQSSTGSTFYKYLGGIGIVCIVASFVLGDGTYGTMLGAFGFAAIIVSFIDEYRSKRNS